LFPPLSATTAPKCTYTAVPDNNYLVTATGTLIFYGNLQVRSLGLWTTRTGVWVAPAIQSYTARRLPVSLHPGYRDQWLRRGTGKLVLGAGALNATER
jgi:hypothetical protein